MMSNTFEYLGLCGFKNISILETPYCPPSPIPITAPAFPVGWYRTATSDRGTDSGKPKETRGNTEVPPQFTRGGEESKAKSFGSKLCPARKPRELGLS